ncbi:MAG: GNAT family N-acetyltransferase [Desulfarculaceae bacterium]
MSRSQVMVRPAESGDLSMMTALLEELFSIEPEFGVDAEKQRRGLEQLLASGRACLLAAEAGGRVVGMVSGQMVISTAEGGLSLWAEDLVVEPAWRGRGVGRMLMQALEDWARQKGVTRLQLLADQNNRRGVEFHRHLGWRPTGMFCMRKKNQGEV